MSKTDKKSYPGCYIPVGWFHLYEVGALNAEELMLLWKIDRMGGADFQGTEVTNRELAAWWRKTPNWVSTSLSKFIRMGLVEVHYQEDQRTLFTHMKKAE